MNIIDLYTQDMGEPRHAGPREAQGACPGCGGTDRFCLYPEQGSGMAAGLGTFHCGHGKGGNGCGKGGDAIQYLVEFRDLSFKEACGFLGIEIKGASNAAYYMAPTTQKTSISGKTFSPAVLGYPEQVEDPQLWSKKGLEFVERCHQALLDRQKSIDYLAGRGISMASIMKYKLGFHAGQERQGNLYQPSFRPWPAWGMRNEKKENGRSRKLMLPAGLVIPYIVDGILHRITIRLLLPDPQNPKKKYHYVVGSMRDVWLSNPSAKAFVTSEAELDCIAVDEAAGDLVGTVGIGSTGVKPERRAADALSKSLCILDGLDYDQAGANAGVWWQETYPQSKRWPVPEGKDPGEAFAAGVDLRMWILAGLPPVFHEAPSPVHVPEKQEATAADPRVAVAPDSKSDLVELRKLLQESRGAFIIYNQGSSVKREIPDDWARANIEAAARISDLLYRSDPVGEFFMELADGLYRYQVIPG
ncbi:MAG: hypothetical protein KKA76_07610 [Proteobacteria bacterium]|nr:hypothetical protein [Pseudomonadota bacterium]